MTRLNVDSFILTWPLKSHVAFILKDPAQREKQKQLLTVIGGEKTRDLGKGPGGIWKKLRSVL
jgi:hypothetical protein